MLSLIKNVSYSLLSICLYVSYIPFNDIDRQLKPIVKDLMNDVHAHCKPGQYFNPDKRFIEFANLKDSDVGECTTSKNYYIISIDRRYWYRINEDERYDIMAHELAHCLLFKEHVDNPDNYMYYRTTDLKKAQIKQQFIQDLEEHCGK